MEQMANTANQRTTTCRIINEKYPEYETGELVEEEHIAKNTRSAKKKQSKVISDGIYPCLSSEDVESESATEAEMLAEVAKFENRRDSAREDTLLPAAKAAKCSTMPLNSISTLDADKPRRQLIFRKVIANDESELETMPELELIIREPHLTLVENYGTPYARPLATIGGLSLGESRQLECHCLPNYPQGGHTNEDVDALFCTLIPNEPKRNEPKRSNTSQVPYKETNEFNFYTNGSRTKAKTSALQNLRKAKAAEYIKLDEERYKRRDMNDNYKK